MYTKNILWLVVLATSAQFSYADCKDVIALSRLKSEIVQDSSSLDTYARNFCSEYSSAKANGKSMNVGVSYAALAASFGQSSTSAEQVASRYCDATDVSKARSDAYRQYVESIAPGAYSAYERCTALEGEGITIAVDPASILPTFFVASVSFKYVSSSGTQSIDYATSPDVKCSWKNGGRGSQTTLKPNSSDALTCQRNSDTQKSSVHIFPTSKPSSQFSFAWDRYEQGLPVDTLKNLQTSVADSIATFNEATRSFQNSVVSFASNTCPNGWDDYIPAYGRFIRGIDKAKASDPDGTRGAGNIQEDSFRVHEHTRPNDVYDAGSIGPGSVGPGAHYGYAYSGSRGGPGPNTGQTGGPETRPKNVALLYCLRK